MVMLIENAHSVKAAAYTGKVFRFCVHTRPVHGFPSNFALVQASDLRDCPLEQDGQGILRGRDEDILYSYDPPTGNFRLGGDTNELLSGQVQAGESEAAFLRVALITGDRVHGFGAASGRADCNDREFRLLNRATGVSSAESSSFPFFIIRRGSDFRGVLLNTALPLRAYVEAGEESAAGITSGPGVRFQYAANTETSAVDVFIFHGSLPEILSDYTRITGRPAMPPAWGMGYHQAGNPKSGKALLELAEKFEARDFPCDALYLDDNHLEDHRAFVWNAGRFSDATEMHAMLAKQGIRTVAAVRPAVRIEDGYKIYQQGKDGGHYCRTGGEFDYVGRRDFGNVAFPDFTREATRAWWGSCHGELFRAGVGGIWNLDGEPELRGGKKYNPFAEDLQHAEGPHARHRNLYANLFAEAAARGAREFRPDERPLVLSRAGFCGIQRDAGLHLEEREVSWSSLRESLNRLLHLGLTGVPFAGAETGGLSASGGLFRARNKELFMRGLELGSMLPYFRMEAGNGDGPWSFNADVQEICRKHIRRRYRLLPYLYALMLEAHKTGAPVIRPLFYDFPEFNDAEAHEQFMLGPGLLAAPILAEGRKRRKVVLPPGEWIEYETGKVYAGDETHELAVQPGYYPLFTRAGAVLPMCEARSNAEESLRSEVSLEIHPADTMQGSLILDDLISSDRKYYHLKVSGKRDRTGNLKIRLKVRRESFMPHLEKVRIRLPLNYRQMTRDGEKTQGERINLTPEDRNREMYEFQVEPGNMDLEFAYASDWNF